MKETAVWLAILPSIAFGIVIISPFDPHRATISVPRFKEAWLGG